MSAYYIDAEGTHQGVDLAELPEHLRVDLERGVVLCGGVEAPEGAFRTDHEYDLHNIPSKHVVHQHLHNMGYRPLDSVQTKWAKPVGYSLYFFDVPSLTWEQRVQGTETGKTGVYSRVAWGASQDTLSNFLAHTETFCSHSFTGEGREPWGFYTETYAP